MQMIRLLSCLLMVVSLISPCQAADIIANPETQALINKVAVQLGSGVRERARQGLADLEKLQEAYTNQVLLVQQIMYYLRFGPSAEMRSSSSDDERRGNGLIVLVSRLSADKMARVAAALPVLDSPDAEFRHVAASILNTADSQDDKGVDFQVYEGLLREGSPEQHMSLVRYMYDRNPEAAVLALARMYDQPIAAPGISGKTKAEMQETLSYFAARPEWWAQLYAAEVIRKERMLRDPKLIEQLKTSTNELVREAAAQIGSKQ